MELKETINCIISETFDRLQYAYQFNHENNTTGNDFEGKEIKTRIVFPKKRDEESRISEQELRFAFIEAFNQYCNDNNSPLYYSIETPTKDKYSNFKDTPKVSDDGRSAEFDAVIFKHINNKFVRVCIIEFKANNADETDHKKDIVKLNNEKEGDNNVLRFFIEIVKSYKEGTISSLKDKMKEFKFKDNFICYSLKQGERINMS